MRKYWETPVESRVEAQGPARVPDSVLIGDVRISPATILAPMAGVTDTVFRQLIRNQGGCGLLMTEFTSSHGVVQSRGARRRTFAMRYLAFEPEERAIGDDVADDRLRGPRRPPIDDTDAQPLVGRDVPESLHRPQHRAGRLRLGGV